MYTKTEDIPFDPRASEPVCCSLLQCVAACCNMLQAWCRGILAHLGKITFGPRAPGEEDWATRGCVKQVP